MELPLARAGLRWAERGRMSNDGCFRYDLDLSNHTPLGVVISWITLAERIDMLHATNDSPEYRVAGRISHNPSLRRTIGIQSIKIGQWSVGYEELAPVCAACRITCVSHGYDA